MNLSRALLVAAHPVFFRLSSTPIHLAYRPPLPPALDLVTDAVSPRRSSALAPSRLAPPTIFAACLCFTSLWDTRIAPFLRLPALLSLVFRGVGVEGAFVIARRFRGIRLGHSLAVGRRMIKRRRRRRSVDCFAGTLIHVPHDLQWSIELRRLCGLWGGLIRYGGFADN